MMNVVIIRMVTNIALGTKTGAAKINAIIINPNWSMTGDGSPLSTPTRLLMNDPTRSPVSAPNDIRTATGTCIKSA